MHGALRTAALLLAIAALATSTYAAGAEDGIAIHGHWRLEVFTPDGALVGAYEFDNAYVGGPALAWILRGEQTPGLWLIDLLATSGDMPCDDGGLPTSCRIVEPEDPSTNTYSFKNLTVSGATQIVLAGSATCANATEIDTVQTFLALCDPATAPGTCTGGTPAELYWAFTSKDLTTPVPVQPGWIVQVTVNLSFS